MIFKGSKLNDCI